MKNTVLNFEKIEIMDYDGSGDTFIFRNLTDEWYEFPDKYYNERYYDNVMVEDDERLDLLCYKYYGSIDYWDLILVYNKMSSPLLLPKNYNFVVERGEIRYAEWEATYGEGKPEWFLESKKRYFTQVSAVDNEKYRTVKMLKREYVTPIKKEISNGFRVK